MNETRNGKKVKKQHIQVFVRVRPISDAERAGRSVSVVDTPSYKELIIREKPCDKRTKKFTFDRVFGASSKQLEVYNAVVCPLLEEVVAGYNCTVLAYGQTSTGKTFTMEGIENDPKLNWQDNSNAGIIPRSLDHLFEKLWTVGIQEYSVRVSYLELYNEEVYDLLSVSDDAAKIRIYEDSIKKGAIIVHGLEEVTIYNKADIYKILEKGSEKRRTATTLMNASSSRSHTIFSITVHIKENTIDGEELLKTGKLNLVDLAGSENIRRSGAADKRVREAGSINQSLLTLGRVITGLVEKTPHIPYRESKLTRLLQESLGGRARTSIIATVSPASINLEETLSTLDYAHRARNITNRPEINIKLSKKALLQQYTEEIEKLRKELSQSRERNGVYLDPDNYNEMQSVIGIQSNQIEERLNYIKALEETLHYKEQLFNDLQSRNSEEANELSNIKNQLESTTHNLMNVVSHLEISEQEKEEQKHLVEKHVITENILRPEVQTVLDVVDTATTDVYKLHDKIYRKMEIGQRNSTLGQQIKHNIKERCRKIEADFATHKNKITHICESMNSKIYDQNLSRNDRIEKSIQDIIDQLVIPIHNTTDQLTRNTEDSHAKYKDFIAKKFESLTDTTRQERERLNNFYPVILQNMLRLKDNKVDENLEALNNGVSENFHNILRVCNEFKQSLVQSSTDEYNRLNANIQDIKENIEYIRTSENSITEKRVNFAKMMEELHKHFNEMQNENQENHFFVCSTLTNMEKTCNIINDDSSNTRRIRAEEQSCVQEELERQLQKTRGIVSKETEKLLIISQDSIAQAKALIDELQKNLNDNSNALSDYHNHMEHSIIKIQEKMHQDENLLLPLISDIYTAVNNVGNERSKCLNNLKTALNDVSAEINKKLETENLNIINGNSKIMGELHMIRDRVEKFFLDDLYRDVSTGQTPVKRTFQYSKHLAKTSPLNNYSKCIQKQ